MNQPYDIQLFIFSDELKNAINELRNSENRLEEYKREIAPTLPDNGRKCDRRDIADMIRLEPGKTPEEEKAYVREVILDLEGSDPERRYRRLDSFFDQVDDYDPRKLDLSCMNGQDKEIREPGKLTASERDFMKMLQNFRRGQAIGTKSRENPDYIEKRYQSPEAQETKEIKRTYATLGTSMYMTQVLMLNGYNQLLDEVVPYPMMTGTDNAKVASVALQRYDNYMSGLEHSAINPEIRFSLTPDQANLYGLDKQLMAGKVSAEMKNNAVNMFDSTLDPLCSDTDYLKRLDAAGVNPFDLIHINGKSVNELYGDKYKNLSDRERKNMLKTEVMGAVMGGKSHIDLINIEKGADGMLKAVTTPVHPDLHAYDKMEKQAEHGRLHRMFDWGPGKIKTKADLIDKMEKDLAGKEPLTRESEGRINEKLGKLNEKVKDRQPEAKKAEEKKEMGKKGISLSELEKPGKTAQWEYSSASNPLQGSQKLRGDRGIGGHRLGAPKPGEKRNAQNAPKPETKNNSKSAPKPETKSKDAPAK